MTKDQIMKTIAHAWVMEEAAQMGEPDPWPESLDDSRDRQVVEGWLSCAEAVETAIRQIGYTLIPITDLLPRNGAMTRILAKYAQHAEDFRASHTVDGETFMEECDRVEYERMRSLIELARDDAAARNMPAHVMRAESVEADFGGDQWTFRLIGEYEVGAGEYLIIPVPREQEGDQ